ncbi:MAG: DUF2099 family protein [Candidatus Bathyarchaeota archaeon]|nr:MAG: DUF2099 family protein [Candidatus Bathyarchaeota archaeon]
MELAKVVAELENKGEYWRGDSRIWIKNKKIYCEYLPKEDHPPQQLFNGNQIKEHWTVKYNHYLRIEAPEHNLADLVSLINSIKYPDEHVVKRAGCKVKIRDGRVVEIGEPRILYCPLAKENYGRPACTECAEVIPFLKRELAGKIKEGMFTVKRKICEDKARYTYGASEMLMDGLRTNVIDAAVVVCDGAGTVIVKRPDIVQGIGEKMTGIFRTSPHKQLITRLEKEGAFIAFPETARIDQLKGIEAAIKLGCERIAVTTADEDSKNLKKIKEIDHQIMALALCTTGIGEETARMIQKYADLVWACGSIHVRRIVGPKAWVQLGTKFPVFVLTERGFDLAKPRIMKEFSSFYNELSLDIRKKYHNCIEVDALPVRSKDEPYPLI